MKALALVAVLVGAGAAAGPRTDVVAARLADLRAAAKCATAASPWCIAADFAKGTAPALPRGKVLVGLTVELANDADAAAELVDRVSFVAFAVSTDGKVKLTDVHPTDSGEEAAIAEAIANAARVFEGKAKVATVQPSLGATIKTLAGTFPTTKTGTEWTFTGATPSHLRKVGAFWVAIEAPEDGIFATVLTDAWR